VRSPASVILLVLVAGGLAYLGGMGCARYPGSGDNVFPDRVIKIKAEMADAINPQYYYYMALTSRGDTTIGPLPIDQGPFWGNGWGTGLIDFYVIYHAGQYRVFRPRVLSAIVQARGGITQVSGNPTKPLSGSHRVSIDSLALGAVTVGGTGTVTAATNVASQNAGVLALTTDASGRTVAGTVTFTPAEHGGRALTSTEQATVDGLSAGGVALSETALLPLGLRLTLGAAAAGEQTLTIAPTEAQITDRFASYFGVNDYTNQGVLFANDVAQGPTPPIPGVTFTTGTLVAANYVEVVTQYDATADELPTPFDSQDPSELDGRTLSVVLDLAQVGNPTGELQFNVITTDQLVLDPEVLGRKSYDGLGPDGTSFVTLRLDSNLTVRNSQAIVPEFANDVVLGDLSADQFQAGQIDITDWQFEVLLTGNTPGESGES
jgi:hypothetical protein